MYGQCDLYVAWLSMVVYELPVLSLCLWHMTLYQWLSVTLYVTGVNMVACALSVCHLGCVKSTSGDTVHP